MVDSKCICPVAFHLICLSYFCWLGFSCSWEIGLTFAKISVPGAHLIFYASLWLQTSVSICKCFFSCRTSNLEANLYRNWADFPQKSKTPQHGWWTALPASSGVVRKACWPGTTQPSVVLLVPSPPKGIPLGVHLSKTSTSILVWWLSRLLKHPGDDHCRNYLPHIAWNIFHSHFSGWRPSVKFPAACCNLCLCVSLSLPVWLKLHLSLPFLNSKGWLCIYLVYICFSVLTVPETGSHSLAHSLIWQTS